MSVPLVWCHLTHDKRRTAIGIAGVAFTVILMLTQLGFWEALTGTAVTILDALDFDLLLTSPAYLYVYESGSFPRARLDAAAACSGVRDAVPFYVGFTSWQLPPALLRRAGSIPGTAEQRDQWGQQRAIFVLGFRPSDRPFGPPRPGRDLKPRLRAGPGPGGCLPAWSPPAHEVLVQPDTLLFDRRSRPEFGPLTLIDPCEAEAVPEAAGRFAVELGRRPMAIVGDFALETGFGADGAALLTDANFARAFAGRSLDDVSLGLVRLEPGVDPEAVARTLAAWLPRDDVRVLTRAEILAQETRYWINEKHIGVIFRLGILIAFIVGLIFIYQILASDLTNRFGELATLKAMGYSDRFIASLVIKQALVLALAGFLPGLLIADLLAFLIREYRRIPVATTAFDVAGVYVAASLMCGLSAALAIRRVRRADPADLF